MDGIPPLIEFVRNVAAGAWAPLLVAFLLERVVWFQKLSAEAKKWVVPAIFVVLPILAQVALQFVPADAWALLEPYWNAIALGFVGYVGSQAAHAWDKSRTG